MDKAFAPVYIKDRTSNISSALAVRGRKRGGSSPGYRVQMWTNLGALSVYPADARVAAMKLLELADECEAGRRGDS